MNTLRIGPKDDKAQEKIEEERANQELVVIEEGADGDGQEVREEKKLPDTGAARKKHFLTEAHLKDFTFEKGRQYSNDFYNPYLDFNGMHSRQILVLEKQSQILTLHAQTLPSASRATA
jgi:hypothetical protein